jgi:dihydroorotase
MKRARKGIFATVTPHHLLATRNDMLGQGFIDPHYFCMPIPKEEDDRLTLLHYVFSELANVGIGTDSAPHAQHGNPKEAKETGCGCAGCFVAHAGLEFYAEAAESVGRLHVLPAVLDRARQFYRLPKLKGQVRLTRQSWQASENYEFGDAKVVPFRQGTPLQWRAERVL